MAYKLFYTGLETFIYWQTECYFPEYVSNLPEYPNQGTKGPYLEDLSAIFEGKYLKTSIKRSRFEIMVKVYVLHLKCYQKYWLPLKTLFMQKKKKSVTLIENYQNH